MAKTKASRLILVGMMGSGKSTVGRLLADATGWPYLDNDALLEKATGRTAREVAAGGEAAVRAAESAALREGLAAPEPVIVGAAAGTILEPANRAAMAAAGTVVWLRGRPETLAKRAARGSHRPWLGGDALSWMRRAAAEREPLYESVSDVTVDVDRLAPEQVATRILDSTRVGGSRGTRTLI